MTPGTGVLPETHALSTLFGNGLREMRYRPLTWFPPRKRTRQPLSRGLAVHAVPSADQVAPSTDGDTVDNSLIHLVLLPGLLNGFDTCFRSNVSGGHICGDVVEDATGVRSEQLIDGDPDPLRFADLLGDRLEEWILDYLSSSFDRGNE